MVEASRIKRLLLAVGTLHRNGGASAGCNRKRLRISYLIEPLW